MSTSVPAATRMPERIARLFDGAPCVALSPHLDDAVLSCGGLLSSLPSAGRVTVATLFTASHPGPHTRAARAFLRQCRTGDAEELFRGRREEDLAVLGRLGARPFHAGLSDALFRRRETPGPARRLGALLPELVHRYPTFRFDIALGRVSRGDRRMIDGIDATVGGLLRDARAEVLLVPIGVGRHVDHLITRGLGDRHPDRVVYYSDFPYDVEQAPDARAVASRRLRPWTWDANAARRVELIRGYLTQVDALFPDGRIPVTHETYYCPA